MTVVLRALGLIVAFVLPSLAAAATCPSQGPFSPPFRVVTEAPASGAPLSLAWTAPPGLVEACPGASFLVLSLPRQTRFAGAGVMALQPGAEAPFDIAHARDEMRLFIPLHDPDLAQGQVDILPYVTGGLSIDWAIVQVPNGAGGPLAAVVTPGAPVDIALAAGAPRLVVQDPFDTTAPLERILSNSGEFLLEVYENRFRVLDARTGALIHAAQGFEPNFSPGSRFVHAVGPAIVVEELEDDTPFLRADLSVVDLYAEREVLRLGGTGGSRSDFLVNLTWGAQDSFLFVGFSGDGGLAFQQMLHDDRPLIANHLGCGACSGASEDALAEWLMAQGMMKLGVREGESEKFDLIDLYAPARNRLFDYDNYTSAEITTPDTTAPGLVTRFDLSTEAGRSWALFNPQDELLPEPVITHRRVEGRAQNDRLAALVQAGSGQSRGGVALGGAAAVNPLPRALMRLADFGIALAEPPVLVPDLDETARAALVPQDDSAWDEVEFYDDEGEPIDEVLRAYAARPQDCAAAQPAVKAGHLTADQARALCAAESLMLHEAGFEVCHASETRVWTLATPGRVSIVHQNICRMGTSSGAHGLVTWMHHDRTGPRAELLSGAPMLFANAFDDEGEPIGGPGPRGVLPLFGDARLAVFALSPDRLAIAGRDRQIVVIDPSNPAQHLRIAAPTAADDIDTMRQTADGRHLLHLDRDGQFHLFGLDRGAQVMSGRHIDDEIVVTDGDLRFDATPEGASFVQVKFPGDPVLFPLSSLAAQRRVEGLVTSHLNFAPRLQPAPPLGLPPRAEIVSQDQGMVRLRAEAAGGLATVTLYRDGQKVLETPLSGTGAQVDIPLTPLPETRWFSLRLRDAAGLESRPIVLPHSGEGPATGRLHVLAVGTDRYDDPAISPLRFAGADARAFAAAFAPGGGYAGVEAEVLIDTPDLAQVMLDRLASLAGRMQPQDTLFVHIAGHGFADLSGNLYLAHRDTRLDDLAGTALGFDTLARALSALPGRVVVFLDACHSGAAASMSNDDAAGLFLGLDRPLAVLAASKGRQLSFESPALRGGAFTGAITAALADPSSDLDGNGRIELDELYARIKADVVRATDGAQTPWIAQSGFVGPVPLL